MTTKAAIIATVVVIVAAIVLGLVAVRVFVDPHAGNADQRAGMLGQGLAMLCLLPLFGIWLSWAVRFRDERERRKKAQKLRR